MKSSFALIILFTAHYYVNTTTPLAPYYDHDEVLENMMKEDGTNGNLYDIFKQRLQRVQQDLSYHELPREYSKETYQPESGDDDWKYQYAVASNRNNMENHIHKNLQYYKYHSQPDNFAHNPLYFKLDEFQKSIEDDSGDKKEGLKIMVDKGSNRKKMQISMTNVYQTNNLNRHHDNLINEYDDIVDYNVTPLNKLYRRRQTENITDLTDNGQNTSQSLYPSVLTNALEISLSPTLRHETNNGSLLSNIAQRMNTSTLDLAKKLTMPLNMKIDPNILNKMVQSYINGNGMILIYFHFLTSFEFTHPDNIVCYQTAVLSAE